MEFTREQYELAIANLKAAMAQLKPDGRECAICGSDCHQAFECGHNPLVAMLICKNIADDSEVLHARLHYLAGYCGSMGVQRGPRKVVLPE